MIRNLTGLMLTAAFSLFAVSAQQPATAPAPPAQTPAQAPTSPQSPPSPGHTPAPQAGAASGQSSDDTQTVLHLGVNEVNLIFTVTDKHGRYIPNLQQGDFALLDNQKTPARVNSFHQQINLPLRVGIELYASTSIRPRFQFHR